MPGNASSAGRVELVHERERERYEARADGAVLGVLAYEDLTDGAEVLLARDLRSTVVSPEHSGQGIGSALVRYALEDLREDGIPVRATCWFVAGYIDRHPEFQDLLA